MKRLLQTILLSAACLAASTAYAYDFQAGDLYYNILDANAQTCEVTKDDNSAYSFVSSVTIPEAVTYNGKTYTVAGIGEEAFGYCPMSSVTIPASVTSIGVAAFSYCEALTGITVAPGNPSYRSADGVLYTKDMTRLLQYPCGSTATSFEIPNTVTAIGDYAFASCRALASIVIPASVTSIGEFAFSCCVGLTSVAIPEGITSIPRECFSACESLSSVTIPSTVTTIGRSSFYGCTSLTFVAIPASVTSIGEFAFSGSGLTSVALSDGLTSIGDLCFFSCGSLTSVTIPTSVTSIGMSMFMECTSLTSVTLPNKLTSIPSLCFANCRQLKEINSLNPAPPELDATAFTSYVAEVNVPIGSLDAYKAADYWKFFENIQEKDFGGIGAVEADGGVSVTAVGGRITVSGADGDAVEVYTAGGQLVYCGEASSIPVAGRGVYIVRVAGQAFKVAL